MKSFEISIVCAQTRFHRRAVSSEKLDCGWRVCIANSVVSAANEVLVESTALFYCYFQNSKLSLIEFQNIGQFIASDDFHKTCKTRTLIFSDECLIHRGK